MAGMLWVALGGALGSAARYGVNLATIRFIGPAFPWGTLAVNVIGSFLMGLFMALWAQKFPDNDNARLFLMTGLLGGFTTFSAFSLDVLNLMQRGDNGLAIVYAAASVVLSIATVFAGFFVWRLVV
jgi:CrcB protein